MKFFFSFPSGRHLNLVLFLLTLKKKNKKYRITYKRSRAPPFSLSTKTPYFQRTQLPAVGRKIGSAPLSNQDLNLGKKFLPSKYPLLQSYNVANTIINRNSERLVYDTFDFDLYGKCRAMEYIIPPTDIWVKRRGPTVSSARHFFSFIFQIPQQDAREERKKE